MEIGLSLGSNLGDRLRNLREAATRIAAVPGVAVLAMSPVYETEPVDVRPEFRDRRFLNAVVLIDTAAAPAVLALALHAIEDGMGRVRTEDRNAPRPVDIDIIYAGLLRVRERGLTIPHPRWSERRFVVAPLAAVRPGLVIPGEERTVAEVLQSLPAEPAVALVRPSLAGE